MRLWQTTLPEIGPSAPVQVSRRRRGARGPVGPGAAVRDRGRRRCAGSATVSARRQPGTGRRRRARRRRRPRRHRHRARRRPPAPRAGTGPSRPPPSPSSGDRVLVAEDQNVIGLDPATGTTRFLTHFDGQLTALTGFAGRPLVVVQGGDACCSTRTGASSRGCPATSASTRPQTHLVGWTADRLDVLGTDGRLVATWPTRSTSLVSERTARPRDAAGRLPLRLHQGLDLRLLDHRWLSRAPCRSRPRRDRALAGPHRLVRPRRRRPDRRRARPRGPDPRRTAGRTGCGRWSCSPTSPSRSPASSSSPPGRSGGPSVLDPSGSGGVGLPEPAVWMLATLFSFGLSLLLTAGLRAPWWLRVLALLVVLAALGAWSLRTPGTSGSAWWPVARARPARRRWSCSSSCGRAGRSPGGSSARSGRSARACLVVGLVENHYSVDLGSDQVPLLLQYLAVGPRLPRAARRPWSPGRRSRRSACG